jgi:hypothetical protein
MRSILVPSVARHARAMIIAEEATTLQESGSAYRSRQPADRQRGLRAGFDEYSQNRRPFKKDIRLPKLSFAPLGRFVGTPYTVRYEAVNTILLNEFLKKHRKVVEREATISGVKSTAAKTSSDQHSANN